MCLTFGRTHYHRQASVGATLPCAANSCPAAETRRTQAFNIRVQRAVANLMAFPCHDNNGDEQRYPTEFLGTFSKGLLHNATTGLVDVNAMRILLQCIELGDFSTLQLAGNRKLTNPQAGLMFELWGGDTQVSFELDLLVLIFSLWSIANSRFPLLLLPHLHLPKLLPIWWSCIGERCCATFLLIRTAQIRSLQRRLPT